MRASQRSKPRREAEAFSAHRTALFLYGLLVVLPAVVLGGLLAHQLVSFQRRQLAAVPAATRDSAARLETAIADQVLALLAEEDAREYTVYAQDYFDPTTASDGRGWLRYTPPLGSPLPQALVPGVRGWFAWNRERGAAAQPVVIPRKRAPEEDQVEWIERRRETEQFLAELVVALESEPYEDRQVREARMLQYPVEQVALNLAEQRDETTLREGLEELQREMRTHDRTLDVTVSQLEVTALRDSAGALWIVARRNVWIAALPEGVVPPDCFLGMRGDTSLVQGLVLDTDWLLRRLPKAIEQRILGTGMRLDFSDVRSRADTEQRDLVVGTLDLFDALGVETWEPRDRTAAQMHVLTSTGELRHAFRVQLAWLIGVVGVMATSLVIGIRLLVGSVRTSQEQARRTENFVAAVTHELRTPVAAVKLYGEMLRDGWASSEAKRREYLDLIVRESDRLDGLVDRLLRKRKLADAPIAPVAGDLNGELSHLVAELSAAGPHPHDLRFQLAAGLPPVLLLEEAVRDIVVNLVENARKYAAVPPGGEPILVATRLDRRGKVLLEVSDRGPGIPESERTRVFDAFYRIGDESTRRAAGTGLGLHLVKLQAKSIRAKVQALPRAGGGATLRVTFRTLRPGTLDAPRP